MIYTPREDSFLLAEQVKKHAFGKVLDIGTGSGIQAEAAANCSKVKSVLAVDISDEVVCFLKKKIKNKKIKIKKSNLFSNVKGKFDTIIFNPPYLPIDKREPIDSQLATTGGKKGYELLVKFISSANDYLSKDGVILIVFSSLTKKNIIDETFSNYGFDFELLSKQHISFEDLFVYKINKNWLLKWLVSKNVVHIKKLMQGHRGMIFTGNFKKKKIAVKAQRLELKVRTVDRETGMIKKLNKYRIAPKILFSGNNYFAYEFIEGEFIKYFLEHADRNKIKKVFLEVLRQCRVLDKLKITKEEMHNPWKHVISGKKIVLVDFERAHYDPYPKNITQFCQYAMRNFELFSRKGIHFKRDAFIEAAKNYKNNQTENNYRKIKALISAF